MSELSVPEVIDPHIHLFDVAGTPRPTQPIAKLFGWNEKLLRAVAKKAFPKPTLNFFGERNNLVVDYLMPEFRADSTSSNVTRFVHIEAGWKNSEPLDAVGETEWLDTLTDKPDGIVAHADLALGDDVVPILAAQKAASPRVRGIRDMLANHPSPTVMDFSDEPAASRSAAFRTGFAHLAERDLSYDAWVFSHQLDQVAELASAIPEVPMVLCHGGTPVGYAGEFHGVGATTSARDRIAGEWREGIHAVAAHRQVRVKLSGFLMPVVGFGFEHTDANPTTSELVDRLGPLVRHCIDTFGPDRAMVASNFPVDRVSTDYHSWFDAMVELTEQDGAAAQARMFGGTAADFYRLG